MIAPLSNLTHSDYKRPLSRVLGDNLQSKLFKRVVNATACETLGKKVYWIRICSPLIAATSALIKVVTRIMTIAELVIRGIGNILGVRKREKYSFRAGVKMIGIDLTKEVVILPYTAFSTVFNFFRDIKRLVNEPHKHATEKCKRYNKKNHVLANQDQIEQQRNTPLSNIPPPPPSVLPKNNSAPQLAPQEPTSSTASSSTPASALDANQDQIEQQRKTPLFNIPLPPLPPPAGLIVLPRSNSAPQKLTNSTAPSSTPASAALDLSQIIKQRSNLKSPSERTLSPVQSQSSSSHWDTLKLAIAAIQDKKEQNQQTQEQNQQTQEQNQQTQEQVKQEQNQQTQELVKNNQTSSSFLAGSVLIELAQANAPDDVSDKDDDDDADWIDSQTNERQVASSQVASSLETKKDPELLLKTLEVLKAQFQDSVKMELGGRGLSSTRKDVLNKLTAQINVADWDWKNRENVKTVVESLIENMQRTSETLQEALNKYLYQLYQYHVGLPQ